MTDKIERPYGVHAGPGALIAAVKLQYEGQLQHPKDIAESLGVTTTTVLQILGGTWGEPEWYLDPGMGITKAPIREPDTNVTPTGVKSEPRGEYNVDHADTNLHCRVITRDKAGWVKRAQKAGVSLASWVVQQLNTGADLQGKYKGNGDDEDPLLGIQEHVTAAMVRVNAVNDELNRSRDNSTVLVHRIMGDNVYAQGELYRARFLVGQVVKDRAAGWRFCIDHLVKPEHPCPICDMERLIDHIAVMGIELRDGADVVDASTESFVSLPDHLQLAINLAGEVVEPYGEMSSELCKPGHHEWRDDSGIGKYCHICGHIKQDGEA
jgi:hypothetical protein